MFSWTAVCARRFARVPATAPRSCRRDRVGRDRRPPYRVGTVRLDRVLPDAGFARGVGLRTAQAGGVGGPQPPVVAGGAEWWRDHRGYVCARVQTVAPIVLRARAAASRAVDVVTVAAVGRGGSTVVERFPRGRVRGGRGRRCEGGGAPAFRTGVGPAAGDANGGSALPFRRRRSRRGPRRPGPVGAAGRHRVGAAQHLRRSGRLGEWVV